MSLWAIVPVKPLRRGKSRLAGVLTDEERTFINYTMLCNTLEVLKATAEVDQVLVVSRDQSALALAREYKAKTLQEDGRSDNLNAALRRATAVAQLFAAQRLLILSADLPMINVDSIREIIDKSLNPPVVVIAPDNRMQSTNALVINPAGLIEYQFGPHSLKRHTEQAQKTKARLEMCVSPIFGLDLDLPEDLELLRQVDGKQFFSQDPFSAGERTLKLFT